MTLLDQIDSLLALGVLLILLVDGSKLLFRHYTGH
jgi:hypothetical protein